MLGAHLGLCNSTLCLVLRRDSSSILTKEGVPRREFKKPGLLRRQHFVKIVVAEEIMLWWKSSLRLQ